MKIQQKATLISSLCALFLALVKFIASLFSGSVALLASAMDSMVDFAVSAFNFLALKKAAQKPNENYNFGFDKIEALMGLLEGLFIAGVGAFVFYTSVEKIITKDEVDDLNLSIFVMVFASFVTFLLILFLNRVAKRTQNLIVESDCLQYKSDLLNNVCMVLAFGVIYVTNLHIIDAIFGILISIYTIYSAFKIIQKAYFYLMDKALSKDELTLIENIIKADKNILSFHELKSRKTPEMSYLSVHLVFCPALSLLKAHELADRLENEIKQSFKGKNLDIQIHLDPYDDRLQGENECVTK